MRMLVVCGLLFLVLAFPRYARPAAFEVVEFATSDGYTIVADFYPGKEAGPAVILLHQLGSDRTEFGPLAAKLNRLGMNVLVPDARGHGDSLMRGKTETDWRDFDNRDFADMVLDIEAAEKYLSVVRGLAGRPLGLVGSSIQSSTALQYAAKNGSVDALVLLSPGLSYRDIDTRGPMEKYAGRPVFMAASEGDTRSSEAVKELGLLVGPDSGYWMVEGDNHGVGMFDEDPLLVKGILDWLIIKLNGAR